VASGEKQKSEIRNAKCGHATRRKDRRGIPSWETLRTSPHRADSGLTASPQRPLRAAEVTESELKDGKEVEEVEEIKEVKDVEEGKEKNAEVGLAGDGGWGYGAVAAFAFLVVEQRFQEAGAVKVGPECFGDENFGVGDLPEQKIADAHLATGADQ
jgi:hypothetical protein